MGKLTDRQVLNAKTAEKDEFLNDGGGLYARIRRSGVKSWLFRYRVGSSTKWFEIGTYPDMSLAAAREKAAEHAKLWLKKIDPREHQIAIEAAAAAAEAALLIEQAKAKAKEDARLTISQLLNKWERVELKTRKDKGAEIRRSFEKDVLPRIGGVAAPDVTRAMIADILYGVVERGAPIIARNLLGDLRQMFGYAFNLGLMENDPTLHLKRNDFGTKTERDRVLSEAEIKELLAKLPTAKLQDSTVYAVWLMLSTCCRIGEITRARWEDVDTESGTWRIPADNAKNGKEHTVMLSEFSKSYFEKLRALSGTTEWCFPAANKINMHVCIKSISKQVHDRQRTTPMTNRSKATGVLLLAGGEWTPHDLRRSGATIMGSLGVRPDVIEKCLNHVEQNKLVRIYQRQEMKPEQTDAWRLLGDRLSLLTSGASNVISMQRGAA